MYSPSRVVIIKKSMVTHDARVENRCSGKDQNYWRNGIPCNWNELDTTINMNLTKLHVNDIINLQCLLFWGKLTSILDQKGNARITFIQFQYQVDNLWKGNAWNIFETLTKIIIPCRQKLREILKFRLSLHARVRPTYKLSFHDHIL